MTDPFRRDVDDARGRALLRTIRTLGSAQGPRILLDGREVLNFCSNDYLGYAAHPVVRAAAKAAIDDWGWGAGASRLVCGTQQPHVDLEKAVAQWLGEEDAVLFPSGAAANAGIVGAVARRGDTVLSDALNHASIVDACRMSAAEVVVLPHASPAALASALPAARGRALYITDSVFSMDGALAPLHALLHAAPPAVTAVDEAHATGVLGPGGRGACAAAGVRPDFRMMTLSKALGSAGAVVAASRSACDLLRTFARSLMFTTGLPAAAAAAALAALRLVQTRPADRERLSENITRLRTGLASAGFPAPGDPRIPIVPLSVGSNADALAACEALLERGVFVHPIRPPAVPAGTARLRITVTAAHTPAQIDTLLDALASLPALRP